MGIDTVYEQDMQTAHIIQPAEEMAAIIQQFDNIVIVAHGSPDGNAIGAMGSLVKALGKRFVLYNATGIPDYLEWVPLPGKLVTKPSAIPFKPGLIIVLDCGDAWRMGKELLAVFPEYPSVNIDHHLGNPMFASLGNWVDPGMAATGQMVAAVADAAGVPLTGELAQCVYLSLVSDTGSRTATPVRRSSRLPPASSPTALTPPPCAKSSTTNGPCPRRSSGASSCRPFPLNVTAW